MTSLENYRESLSNSLKAHQEDNPEKEVCAVLHTIILEFEELIEKEKQQIIDAFHEYDAECHYINGEQYYESLKN